MGKFANKRKIITKIIIKGIHSSNERCLCFIVDNIKETLTKIRRESSFAITLNSLLFDRV